MQYLLGGLLPAKRETPSMHKEEKEERKKMGSRLGRRVVYFANLPIKLLMPSSFDNITEIALKTIPSASKIEIKRVLESLYGFDVEKVRTLNMEGKKKKRGGILIAKPDYKKAYVTLKSPLSISPDVFPIRLIQEERQNAAKQSKPSVVEECELRSHWLDGMRTGDRARPGKQPPARDDPKAAARAAAAAKAAAEAAKTKFPWTSMRAFSLLAVTRFNPSLPYSHQCIVYAPLPVLYEHSLLSFVMQNNERLGWTELYNDGFQCRRDTLGKDDRFFQTIYSSFITAWLRLAVALMLKILAKWLNQPPRM
ncbi:hypothetical protein ACLOJK_016249 [Asimina triloba]